MELSSLSRLIIVYSSRISSQLADSLMISTISAILCFSSSRVLSVSFFSSSICRISRQRSLFLYSRDSSIILFYPQSSMFFDRSIQICLLSLSFSSSRYQFYFAIQFKCAIWEIDYNSSWAMSSWPPASSLVIIYTKSSSIVELGKGVFWIIAVIWCEVFIGQWLRFIDTMPPCFFREPLTRNISMSKTGDLGVIKNSELLCRLSCPLTRDSRLQCVKYFCPFLIKM